MLLNTHWHSLNPEILQPALDSLVISQGQRMITKESPSVQSQTSRRDWRDLP